LTPCWAGAAGPGGGGPGGNEGGDKPRGEPKGDLVMPASPEELENRWKRREGILAFLCLGAMFPLCLLAERTGKLPLWLINLGLATAFLALVGKATTRIWWGALIADRTPLSLTRLHI